MKVNEKEYSYLSLYHVGGMFVANGGYCEADSVGYACAACSN